MCGIAGLLFKDRPVGVLGAPLLTMLSVLGSRGVDGTGVAVYGEPQAGDLVLRVKLGGAGTPEDQAQRILTRVEALARPRTWAVEMDYLRLVLEYDGNGFATLTDAAEMDDPGVEVFSLGQSLEIVKGVGAADVLKRHHSLEGFVGSHGIGHTRLATESRVDVSHCHPFWARPFPDIAVVHNGQITNYHKLRRLYETRGYRFVTENDSEIIALYIADKLAAGAALEEALESSLDDLDGTFTYLVSTSEGIGLAKDFFACKPLVIAETDRWVAIASEEVALRETFSGEPFDTWEPPARQVLTWRRLAGIPQVAARSVN